MIRVLIIDDSATARRALGRLFGAEPDFEVVGSVGSGAEGVKAAAALKPDLISLDVFLADELAAAIATRILAAWPVPILLVSAAPRHVPEVFEALAAGALDLLAKPTDEAGGQAFVRLARTLSKVKVRVRARPDPRAEIKLVVIGSSTGGPGALRELLELLPARFPVPIAIAQHLASGFEASLANWLSSTSALPVSVAVHGESLRPGHVLLGPAAKDLVIAAELRANVRSCPERGYHPSADLLFETAGQQLGPAVLAVVLTGVGSDGTAGARKLAAAGGVIFAQDRESSTVYGMPGSVTRAGLVSVTGSPPELARAIAQCVQSPERGRRVPGS